MSQAPAIGEVILHEGKPYRRIISGTVQHNAEQVAAVTHGYPYVSRSLPRYLPGCDHDKGGRPIVRSQLHEKEVCARTGRIRD